MWHELVILRLDNPLDFGPKGGSAYVRTIRNLDHTVYSLNHSEVYMSRRFLLLALICSLLGSGIAMAAGGKDGEEVQRKSGLKNPASYPLPFVLGGVNARTAPAISTGYYFVDSDDDAANFWRPDPSQFVDTLTEPATWRRIVSGANQFPASYWTDPTQNNFGGHAYFRNPGNSQDSTDDAFAGPISIGFPFYFNGIRYDSFYVSTNGLIALSNRRYFYEYDEFGFPIQKSLVEVEPGVFTAYDPASDDYRSRSGNGMTDNTADNYGYQFIACGNNPSNGTAGIRTRDNRTLDQGALQGVWPSSVQPALIAAAWDDMQVSVYNSEDAQADDFARVYYKRSPANDKLIIYYVNLTPIRGKTARVGGVTHNVTFAANNRPGTTQEHYRFSMQISLNRFDSSVVVQYERFSGIAPRSAQQPHAATVWMRCNSTVGVTGPSRRLNWAGFPATMPARTTLDYSAPKYTQYTEYLYNMDNGGSLRATSKKNDDLTTPKDFLAIKFKQWKNMLRVINVFYRTHPLNDNLPLDFSVVVPSDRANNYEILAGETRLGSIQPVAIVQNLTNDIQGPQGVNYTQQGLNFKVRFRIQNEATNKIVYNTSKSVNNSALSDTLLSGVVLTDINGVAQTYTNRHFVKPYEFVRVTFPPFEPNPFIDDQIGRLFTSVVAEPRDSNNVLLGDEWPFDDTTGVRLFAMRRLTSFNDDVNEYHVVGGASMPSVLKWVNIESDVVDGDQNTHNPPPPRGAVSAANSPIFTIASPVIRMNRVDLAGLEIPNPGQYGGDQLRSFPINLLGKKRPVMSISYQRSGVLANIDRGYSDNRLLGPEIAVNRGGAILMPDRLFVEYAQPSNDGINNIINLKDWKLDYQNLGNSYVQPYQIWGGAGSARGFSLTDRNQQLITSFAPPTGGYREDNFDDGKDFEFYKITIPMPDTISNWPAEGARSFRFRLSAQCVRNSNPPQPADDEDNFFIDNVKILFPEEVTDVEFSNINLIWPYTLAPASQVTRVPIRVKLSNNTDIPAPSFSVRLQIKPAGDESRQIYCRTITVPYLAGNREVILPFPDANFRQTTPGRYKVTGRIFFPGNDLDTLNDSTFTNFEIAYGDAFAYELQPNRPVNDVPKLAFSGISGKGLNHGGFSYGGASATATMPAAANYGADAGNASGQISMRFTLYTQDTVAGYQAFWGELNQDILNISFSLYPDAGGLPGTQRVANSTIIKRRGEDELDNSSEPQFGKYVTYLLEQPVVLAPGEYWASVAQLGTEGYELGASATRMAMVTTLTNDIPVPGIGNRTLMVDKNFRVRVRSGALLNDNRFAYELTRFSGDWVPFMPTVGNPGYAHLSSWGTSLGYSTFTRGTWIPLLRPFFGERSFANPPVYVDCVVPVELTYFDAKARTAGVDLFWETASEKNNQGFNIERRALKETTDLVSGKTGLNCVDNSGSVENAPWANIGFVAGVGNTTETQNYKFFDNDVASGTTYQYRLRQVDFDGAESFSNVVNVEFSDNNAIALRDNYPNPASEKTTFTFRVPFASDVKLEVYDVMGNLVNTLYDNYVPGQNGDYAIEWNGRDAAGYEVASGTYIYKLTAGDVVVSKNMTIVR